MMSDDDLAALARLPIALPDKAQRMVALANARGGRDNISVLLAQAGAQDTRRSLVSRLLRMP